MIHYLLLSKKKKKKILICDTAEHKLNASSLQILWEKAVFREGTWLKQGCFWANQNCSSLWLQELYFKNFTGPTSASLPQGKICSHSAGPNSQTFSNVRYPKAQQSKGEKRSSLRSHSSSELPQDHALVWHYLWRGIILTPVTEQQV